MERLKQLALEPVDSYGWSAILRNTLPLFALLWLAPVSADAAAYVPWLLAPLVGLLIYRITVVMHDCTHYTLFKSRRLNKAIGSLLGAVTGVDFRSFSAQHWRHHRCYGEPGDPQGFHYAGLKRMTRGEFRRHLLKPLLGLNLRYVFAESLLAPKNLAGEFALVALVQAALFLIVTGFGRHPILAALPMISAATFGLFFSQLRGIAEHGVVDPEVAVRHVRSHSPSWLDRVLLYDVNFNYHSEHHERPGVPSCRLQAARYSNDMSRVAGSMFDTLRTMHENLEPAHE